MTLYTETILPLCLAIFLFVLFLLSNKKDKSSLVLSIFFGGMLFDRWITNNILKDTKFETAWNIFYCILMVGFIVIMSRDTIRNIKYIKNRIKSNN